MATVIAKMSRSPDGYVGRAAGAGDWIATGRSPDPFQWIVDTISNSGARVMGTGAYRLMADIWPQEPSPFVEPVKEKPKDRFLGFAVVRPLGPHDDRPRRLGRGVDHESLGRRMRRRQLADTALMPGPTPTPGSVILMCGIAGAGKTTYAQRLERQGFERLSIDEEVWRRFGRHGIDYPSDDDGRLSHAAEADLEVRLEALIAQARSVVVNFSFGRKAKRDHDKQLMERAGGTWRLLYLRVDPEDLRRRLARRNSRVDPNAAFPITEDILARYLNDFEEPRDEGEEIVRVSDE